jgi:hypothetical protein
MMWTETTSLTDFDRALSVALGPKIVMYFLHNNSQAYT